MAKKIKIKVHTEGKHFTLPGLPLWMVPGIANLALKHALKDEARTFYLDNREAIDTLIRRVIEEVKPMEPFVLVDVQSKDAVILVEIL